MLYLLDRGHAMGKFMVLAFLISFELDLLMTKVHDFHLYHPNTNTQKGDRLNHKMGDCGALHTEAAALARMFAYSMQGE